MPPIPCEARGQDVSGTWPLRIENGDFAVLGAGELGAASPPRQFALQPTNDANCFSVAEPGCEAPVQTRADHITDEHDLDGQQDPPPVLRGTALNIWSIRSFWVDLIL